MIKNQVIVIGGSHSNTLGLIRSVGEVGLNPILVLEPCDFEHDNTVYSKYIKKTYCLKDISDLIDLLTSTLIDFDKKSILLCGSDTSISLIDRHYDLLKKHFVSFNAKEEGRINYFMDKIKMFPLAEKSGLDIIKTWHIEQNEINKANLIYPILVKPNNSLGGDKEDIKICYSEADLKHSLREGVDYLLQEYIDKDYELNLMGLSLFHGKKIIAPAVIRKLREYPIGVSSFACLDELENYPGIKMDAIKTFIESIKYEGLFSIEFVVKNDKCYFLEINMRNDGNGYFYTANGLNLPYLWCKYATNNPIDFNCSLKKIPFYFMSETTDIFHVIKGGISLYIWIKDLIKTKSFYILKLNDIGPFLKIVRNKLLKIFKLL